MRTVGVRRTRTITMHADGILLKQGAQFNDELHKLPTGGSTYIRKGVYRYKSHEDANRHQDECVIERMVNNAS